MLPTESVSPPHSPSVQTIPQTSSTLTKQELIEQIKQKLIALITRAIQMLEAEVAQMGK